MKTELKAEEGKIVKLQTHDLSLFISQNYFNKDGAQLYLVFQPTQKTIATFSGLPYTISEWESKGLPNEKCTPPYTAKSFFENDMGFF